MSSPPPDSPGSRITLAISLGEGVVDLACSEKRRALRHEA